MTYLGKSGVDYRFRGEKNGARGNAQGWFNGVYGKHVAMSWKFGSYIGSASCN